MNNIEKIIKYLSGDMSPAENDQFQKELSANTDLSVEYGKVSSVWKIIQKQLTQEDGPESMDRDMLLAEIMAEHDVQFHQPNGETKKDLAFRKKLRQIMTEEDKPVTVKKRTSPRVISMISLMAAASIAVMFLVFNPSPDIGMLTNQYYQPTEDPVFEALQNRSRSGISSAMYMFTQGDYKASKVMLSDEMQKYPDFTELRLLYALSCYESNDFTEAKNSLQQIIENDEGEITEISRWYLALLNLHSGNNVEAEKHLKVLKDNGNLYQKEARKLLRKME